MELFDKKETRNREMKERENPTRQRKTNKTQLHKHVSKYPPHKGK